MVKSVNCIGGRQFGCSKVRIECVAKSEKIRQRNAIKSFNIQLVAVNGESIVNVIRLHPECVEL